MYENAAEPVQVTAWKNKAGHLFFDERVARYDGCTHTRCECGKPAQKNLIWCEECTTKQDCEEHTKRPVAEWTEGALVYARNHNEYFQDLAEIEGYCKRKGVEIESLHLILCEAEYAWALDPRDIYEDITSDEGDIPVEIEAAFDKLNMEILKCKRPLSWTPGDKRIVLKKKEAPL